MREVTHEATGPRYLTEDDLHDEKGDIAVCQCGLSASFPFCDGSHRRTRDEDDGTTYVYEDGERRRVERIVTTASTDGDTDETNTSDS